MYSIICFVIVLYMVHTVFSCGESGPDKPWEHVAPVAAAPTQADTLRKAEIRAHVYLKLEYGKEYDDIALVNEGWYPNQMMEVVKWRVRDGMAHWMVVTQTKFIGTDIKSSDAYSNWDVKIVNKWRE